jgi:type IV pilus assembly protein PilC
MASFLVSYSGPTGRPRTLTIEAANLTEAKKLLRRRGIRADELRTASPKNKKKTSQISANKNNFSSFNINHLFEKVPGVKEKAIFASKLSALVDAGVPIVRGLDLMASQQKLPMFKRALTKVSLDVNEGIGLAPAMRQWPKVFDTLSIAMVEAGEAGGVLDEALNRLAKLLEDTAKLQNQIKGALGYPITVLIVAILVFFGMTIFLIPTFAEIFEDLGAELPAFTQLLLNLSSLMRSYFSLFFVGAILLIAWILIQFYTTNNGRRTIDRLILKTPLFGNLILISSTAQFCRIFSSLSRAGVPILLTMEISSQTAGNSIISDAILDSREMVREGVLLSEALIRHKVLPDMALNMLAIGEETGELDKMLSKVADFYEDEVETTVKALTSMLEPAMIIIVGGIVGSILIAMYLPMFSVFENII